MWSLSPGRRPKKLWPRRTITTCSIAISSMPASLQLRFLVVSKQVLGGHWPAGLLCPTSCCARRSNPRTLTSAPRTRTKQTPRLSILQLRRIFEVPEADLAPMQRAGSSEAQLQGWVLRMRGLPYSANTADVSAFFDGLELTRGTGGIVFTCTSDGRPLGEAYVEFASEDAQQAAPPRPCLPALALVAARRDGRPKGCWKRS